MARGRKPVEDLTDRNRGVLHAIVELTRRKGYPPSLMELAQHVGLHSAYAVQRHVDRLEGMGYISREPGQARTIHVLRLPKRGEA